MLNPTNLVTNRLQSPDYFKYRLIHISMVFVACGLNHKTAPINVREKVALSPATQDSLLNSLIRLPEVSEATILSTCNRTEIYCETQDPHVLTEWLAREHQLTQ